MRLLNIIQCANLGGMEQASFRLMMAMREQGVESELLSLHPVGALGPLLTEEGIPHHGLRYRGPAGVGIVGDLVTRLRATPADRIVMTGPHVAAMLAMKIAGRKGAYLAVHFHHTGVKSPAVWRWIYRLALDRFQWITFPSDFVRDEACAIDPRLAARSVTIRYPQLESPLVEAEEKKAARARLNLEPDQLVVGNAGWLIPRKRFDVFLKVAAEVLKQEPRAVFPIAGGGEEEANLRQLAEQLGINPQVRWLGWLKDMDDFRKSLDVLHFNSDWDALGLTPQETVAMGIPLVASVVNGGLREVLDATTAARIPDHHDIPALAEQILGIFRQPERARAAALECRSHLLKVTDPVGIARQHLNLLG